MFPLIPLMAAIAVPAPVSILGIGIGQPLSLHECNPSESYLRYVKSLTERKPSRRLDEPLFDYATPTTSPCYQRRHQKFSQTPLTNEVVNVVFPNVADLPVVVESQTIEAVVIHGSVEFVAFETPGLRLQEDNLRTLKVKLGAPETLEPVSLQNGFGAKFEGVRAVWRPSPVITASYSSFVPSVADDDRGKFTIGTAAGIAAYNADIEARNNGQPRLKL